MYDLKVLVVLVSVGLSIFAIRRLFYKRADKLDVASLGRLVLLVGDNGNGLNTMATAIVGTPFERCSLSGLTAITHQRSASIVRRAMASSDTKGLIIENAEQLFLLDRMYIDEILQELGQPHKKVVLISNKYPHEYANTFSDILFGPTRNATEPHFNKRLGLDVGNIVDNEGRHFRVPPNYSVDYYL